MSQRTRRLGERIREIVAEQLMGMKDPRIGFVTVTDVRVSSDVAHAQIFYTVLPDDDETRARTAEGLASAAPTLRRELGRRLRTRNTPQLRFIDDPVAEHSRHIDALIARTRHADAQIDVQAVESGADDRAGGADGPAGDVPGRD